MLLRSKGHICALELVWRPSGRTHMPDSFDLSKHYCFDPRIPQTVAWVRERRLTALFIVHLIYSHGSRFGVTHAALPASDHDRPIDLFDESSNQR